MSVARWMHEHAFSMMRALAYEWRLFLLALGFFTRIPVPVLKDFKQGDLHFSVKYLPLMGALVGGFGALVYWLLEQYLPPDVALILSICGTIYLTGAFHEDGLADTADGLGGGWDKEQALTIMKDSRIGSYGAIALILMLMTKFQALAHLPPMMVPVTLIVGHSLSRYAAVMVIATQQYVRAEGKAQPFAAKMSPASIVVASVFGLLPFIGLLTQLLWALLPVAIAWLWFSLKLKKRLGGYTGDCLGAMQQLTEVVFYLSLLVLGGPLWRFI